MSLQVYFSVFSSPDMPCASLSIVVGFDEPKAKSSIENLRGCITVNVIGGLQITECIEMPGGILIRWDEVFQKFNFTVCSFSF